MYNRNGARTPRFGCKPSVWKSRYFRSTHRTSLCAVGLYYQTNVVLQASRLNFSNKY